MPDAGTVSPDSVSRDGSGRTRPRVVGNVCRPGRRFCDGVPSPFGTPGVFYVRSGLSLIQKGPTLLNESLPGGTYGTGGHPRSKAF